MRDLLTLRDLLERLDGRGYKAYQELRGSWNLEELVLHVDHVQSDPFAAPSRVRLVMPQTVAQFPAATYATRAGHNGLTNYLAECLARTLAEDHPGTTGRDTGGDTRPAVGMDRPGQEMLERTAVRVDEGSVEARLAVSLPAAGRRILGGRAARILSAYLPSLSRKHLVYVRHRPEVVRRWVECAEDATAARALLAERDLVAFVADGSVLPRRSGVDPRPAGAHSAVPWRTPQSLRVELHLPHAGRIVGTGVPRGVTLIVGGGFHGKSTLLQALQAGVYDHRPGDGRELVVTDPTAMKIRAEDGRRVCGVDISPFIGTLPDGRDTRRFTTDNASGSTSQAANIIEALEVGVRVLLIDEDTTASNFMIRDQRMQHLIARKDEPITPLLDRVRQLYDELGVSTILVVGGSGAFFEVADTVIAMRAFVPCDVTDQARAIAAEFPSNRHVEPLPPLNGPAGRIPQTSSVDPRRGRRPVRARARGMHRVEFGYQELELGAVEQLVDPSQTRALAAALAHLRQAHMDGQRTLAELVRRVEAEIDEHGLDVLDQRPMGDRARFRPYELAAALNRLRSLEVRQEGETVPEANGDAGCDDEADDRSGREPAAACESVGAPRLRHGQASDREGVCEHGIRPPRLRMPSGRDQLVDDPRPSTQHGPNEEAP